DGVDEADRVAGLEMRRLDDGSGHGRGQAGERGTRSQERREARNSAAQERATATPHTSVLGRPEGGLPAILCECKPSATPDQPVTRTRNGRQVLERSRTACVPWLPRRGPKGNRPHGCGRSRAGRGPFPATVEARRGGPEAVWLD